MKKSIISLGAVAVVSGALVANTGNAEAATYTVQKGDSLSAIAAEHQTTVNALKTENNLKSDLIFSGQELNINELKVDAEEVKTHTVKSGDTVAKIAGKYDVTVADIVKWNDLKSADLIVVGEKLTVSKPVVEEVATEETYVAPAENNAPAETYEEPAQTYEEPAQTYEQPKQQTYEQPKQQPAPQPVKQETQVQNNGGLNWSGLAACESGGNAGVVSANGLYHGLYQFDVGTWQSVGGTGLPSQASAAEQTKRAQILYNQRGASPWPVCGANL